MVNSIYKACIAALALFLVLCGCQANGSTAKIEDAPIRLRDEVFMYREHFFKQEEEVYLALGLEPPETDAVPPHMVDLEGILEIAGIAFSRRLEFHIGADDPRNEFLGYWLEASLPDGDDSAQQLIDVLSFLVDEFDLEGKDNRGSDHLITNRLVPTMDDIEGGYMDWWLLPEEELHIITRIHQNPSPDSDGWTISIAFRIWVDINTELGAHREQRIGL